MEARPCAAHDIRHRSRRALRGPESAWVAVVGAGAAAGGRRRGGPSRRLGPAVDAAGPRGTARFVRGRALVLPDHRGGGLGGADAGAGSRPRPRPARRPAGTRLRARLAADPRAQADTALPAPGRHGAAAATARDRRRLPRAGVHALGSCPDGRGHRRPAVPGDSAQPLAGRRGGAVRRRGGRLVAGRGGGTLAVRRAGRGGAGAARGRRLPGRAELAARPGAA